MASTINEKLAAGRENAPRPQPAGSDDGFDNTYTLDLWEPFRVFLQPLASLKLSVVLFALAIVIVLAGTFAQARMPLDDAIGTFFRLNPKELVQEGFPWLRLDRLFVWVPVNTFLVPAFGFAEPPLSNQIGIALPKGWTVGLVMMINLLAAHLIRFKVQSDGTRLASGLSIMGLGALVTWLVVMSGSSGEGLQATPLVSYDTLWLMLQIGLVVTTLASLFVALTFTSLGKAERWLLAGVGVVAAISFIVTIVSGRVAIFNDSGMRILYQLLKGTLAGLVLLAGAWLAFGKRAGIVVIHLGVGLLMASEVFVGLKAVESQMLIGEGESSSFLMDPSTVELAVIDHNHPDHPGEDVVTVIPQSMLADGAIIDDERLPFTIQVDAFYHNVDLKAPTADNPATHGLGVEGRVFPRIDGFEVKEAERVVGTDDRSDTPSSYVTLVDRPNHPQPSEGPHHGSLIELGNEEYRAEFLHDEETITIYILDSDATEQVPIKPESITLDVTHDRMSSTRELAANPDQNDPVGTSSRFVLTDAGIVEMLDAEVSTARLSVTIDGTRYSGYVDREGQTIGTWLLSSIFDVPMSEGRFPGLTFPPQSVPTGEENRWEIALRHRRTQVPFEFTLHDIEVEHYVGTNTPRSYEALVSVKNSEDGFERDDIKIWMNNPLRYAGYTFYQSNYLIDRVSQLEATGLQVVSNQGWMVPYVACMIVGVGLTWQFSTSLIRFINRRSRLAAAFASNSPDGDRPLTRNERRRLEREATSSSSGGLAAFEKAFPWVMAMAAMGYLLVVVDLARVHRPASGEYNFALFGRLPVIDGGRVKPIDSLARTTLMSVSDIQTFEVHDGNQNESENRSAVQWLLEMVIDSETYHTAQFLRIENDELLERLGLEHRSGMRYALDEIDEDRRVALQPELEAVAQLIEDKQAVLTAYQRALYEFGVRFSSLQHAQESFFRSQQIAEVGSEYFDTMLIALRAYAGADANSFNQATAKLHRLAGDMNVSKYSPATVSFEAFFNGMAPFFAAWILSIAAFILVCLSWLGWSEPLRKAGEVVMWITFLVITFAIVGRIYISGRPPVTNLYSSAVFIAWVGVTMGLIFERIFRNSMGLVASALAGLLTLKVAHALAQDGDTFTVLQAVLDTQFWLATHVVTITMGYATTYVAGLFGLMYLLSGLAADLFPQRVSESQTRELKKNLVRMMYGTLCFALFFSFVGTVLGGLWADDSWGRFWGWDPKENGALIIVLWNALVLHARWDRIIRDRGLAALCVLGNITVSWSWFGTNALGIGLHAYGFKEGTLMWLSVFVASQVLVACLAFLPDRSQSDIESRALA